jgi:hypothetical protein
VGRKQANHPPQACPRCGEPISYVERRKRGERTYYYAVHERYVNGKRVVRKCYLGPDVYEYAERLNNLGLSGLIDSKRYVKYLSHLLARLDIMTLSKEDREFLARELRAALDKLESRETQGEGLAPSA